MDTLAAAAEIALKMAAEHEKMLGHEPMEVSSAHKDKKTWQKCQSWTPWCIQMHTHLQQTEACLEGPPPKSIKSTGKHRGGGGKTTSEYMTKPPQKQAEWWPGH